MHLAGYCFGIRSERKLCEEVALHLAYRWFCRLDLDDKVPHHSTFSENRLNRFRESDILRHIFERVVMAAMAMGLVKGEGFAVDASVMKANASRYHGKAAGELDWTEKQRQKRAVAEYLAALEAELTTEGGAPNDGDGPIRRPRRVPFAAIVQTSRLWPCGCLAHQSSKRVYQLPKWHQHFGHSPARRRRLSEPRSPSGRNVRRSESRSR